VDRMLDDSCDWATEDHKRARGTCREIGGGLVCVRSRPFEDRSAGDDSPRRPPGSRLPRDLTPLVIIGTLVFAIALSWILRRRKAKTAHSVPRT
jgi:hypothetical protein